MATKAVKGVTPDRNQSAGTYFEIHFGLGHLSPRVASENGCCKVAAIPVKLGGEAEAGHSKAQHTANLTLGSELGITRSACPYDALAPRMGEETELNGRTLIENLNGSYLDGKCRVGSSNSLLACARVHSLKEGRNSEF